MASRTQLPLFPRRPRRRRQARGRGSLAGGGRPDAVRAAGSALPHRRRPARGAVPHRRRPQLDGHFPVHVTLRLRDGLPNLRRRDLYAMLRRAFRLGRDRFCFRLAGYSVQHHHMHLLCEAPSAAALGHGLQGLCIRIAKGVNRVRDARGTVFRERYHARELRTLAEARNALRYVAGNDCKHGNGGRPLASAVAALDGRRSAAPVDVCSSFYFWGRNRLFAGEEAPVVGARTDHLKAALRLELGLRGPPLPPLRAPG